MSTPVPDPTVLTTAALHREIEHMKELITQRIDGLEGRIDRHEALRIEMKADTSKVVDAAKQDTAKAVDTALSAANIATAAVATTTNDLKDRVVTLESIKLGNLEQRTETRLTMGQIIAIVGMFATLIIVAIAIVTFMSR